MVNLVASCTNAGCLVDKTLASSANTVLAIAISTAPLLSADLVAPACAWLVRFVPLLGKLLSELLRRVSAACEGFRLRREQAFVLIHGAVTYAIGDLIAQAAKAHSNGQVLWTPSKTAWAAGIGLLSDTLPFYHWSSLLATIDPQGKRAGVIQRVPLLRRQPALLLPFKILCHLATFQQLSTASYLFMQGLLKSSGDIAAALEFMCDRFIAAALPATASFAVGGPIVYSLPVAAGAALRNLGVLAMCVYLAVVASR